MALTATATASGAGSATGLALALRVVNNASLTQNGATATSESTAVPQLSITPHASGNWVYGAVVTQSGTAYSSLDANTTSLATANLSTGSINSGSYRSTSVTGTSATTYGWAAPTSTNTWISAAEIVAAGTLAEDASTPATLVTTTAKTLTTASFTPPGTSVLVACVSANWSGSGAFTIAMTDTSGGAYTWRRLVTTASESLATVWVGIPASVPTRRIGDMRVRLVTGSGRPAAAGAFAR